jgi:hypothetical protein
MTAPEQQPQPTTQPAVPETVEPAIETIDIDELDKENKGWVVKYLDGLKERLANEQAADQPDFVMISYLKREVATYQELLERTDKK